MKVLSGNLKKGNWMLIIILVLVSTSIHATTGEQKSDYCNIDGTLGVENNVFVNLIDFLPKGYVTDGSIDYTAIIQKVLNENKNVLFPDFPILINDTGLSISSNSQLKFLEGGKLILKASYKDKYEMLRVKDVKNVRLINVSLKGDRANHKGKTGEWGMGISILGSSNIIVEKPTLLDLWGDGIYINKTSRVSENITITDGRIESARRNGITVISGNNILINDCQISQINGTLPMAGICVEPNDASDDLGKIHISNITTDNCGTGVHVALLRLPSRKRQHLDIVFTNLTSVNDKYGILVGDFYLRSRYGGDVRKLEGHVKFSRISINNSRSQPIKYFNSRAGYEFGPNFIFEGIQLGGVSLNGGSINGIKTQLKGRGFNINNF